nr:Na+/H+ antiporter NhaA [Olegusella massiliensis]
MSEKRRSKYTSLISLTKAQEARHYAARIYDEDAVIRRIGQRSALSELSSSSTIAAAVMVFAAVLAVMVANSPLYEAVRHAIEAPLMVGVGRAAVEISAEQFVNDFLMAIFFMLVGVELKYEMTVGQLRYPRQAALPMLAAVGGVVVPAIMYLIFNLHGAHQGWATPIATDIAFALGVMSLLGDKVSFEAKVFFQTLAIADDILAIVVLALFYGQTIDVMWTAAALGAVFTLALLNHAKVYSLKPYVFVGLILWLCMFNSGIHATLAGVILAFFLPSHSDVQLSALRGWLDAQAIELDRDYDSQEHILGQHDFTHAAWHVERVMHHVRPPLQRMEQYWTVPVNFLILPLFAFVNAQVRIVGVDLGQVFADPVAQGVFLGAVFGKPIGIVGVTFLLVKTGIFELPHHVDWHQVVAVGLMGGIGFTMSILIASLAFSPHEVNIAKCAILVAALASSTLGLLYVNVSDALRKKSK